MQQLGDLDRVERRALEQVVAHHEEVEAVIVVEVGAHAPDGDLVAPRPFQRRREVVELEVREGPQRLEGGYSDEEMKLQNESRKILAIPDLAVSPTCVRVPVMVGHAVACRAGFSRPVDVDAALEALRAFPNLVVQEAPTPLEWAGRDEVAVGRVRRDLGDPSALNLFVVGDNLLKGAALNTVQIAERLHERGLVRPRVGAAT